MTDEFGTEETGAPTDDAPFTSEEKLDLVKLLDADPTPTRYYLPEGEKLSEEFYIEVKAWTGVEEIRYEGAGMDYRTPIAQRGQTAPTEARFRMDRIEQMEMLFNSSIVAYHLKRQGRIIDYKKTQQSSDDTGGMVWEKLKLLPTPVLKWIQRTIRQHHGIEVVSGEV